MIPTWRHLFLAIILSFCVSVPFLNAQWNDDEDERILLAFPYAFYTPETRLGFGINGLFAFPLHQGDSLTPISQVQLGAAYTLNKQFIATLPFQFFLKDRKHSLYGELTYNRFFYRFFGIGASQPAKVDEQYEVIFPRIRVHYLRRLSASWFVGARYWFEHQRILDTAPGGQLEGTTITGARGGFAAGPGAVLLFDTRDNLFSSRKGAFAELSFHHQSRFTGSDFAFDRWRIDLRKFVPLHRSHTLAGMILLEQLSGNVPFFQLSSLGNEKRLRGYYEGYFRDTSMLLSQAEWRFAIWKNLGAAAFGSAAWMNKNPSYYALDEVIWTAGAGLRYQLSEQNRVTLRLDYAIGAYSDAVYFTVGEAF